MQYMAAKYPVIAPDYGENTFIINKDNGVLSNKKKEWVDGRKWMYTHKDQSIEMGKSGFNSVKKTYCLEATQSKLHDTFLKAINQCAQ